jgi:hypothetical protein
MLGTTVAAEEQIDNGTDPTKLSRNAQIRFESLDLGDGFTNNILFLRFTQPLGSSQKSSLEFKLPVVSNNIAGDADYGIGDVILKFSHLPVLTQKYAILLTLEASFDTADKAEHGLGSNVLRPGITYARFLPGGSLFAPTVQHAFSVGDVDQGRIKVNNTVIDLYYVPKLKNPRNYMTIDPAVLYDWEREKLSASLAVTFGRVIPTALPGTSSVFIKPSIGIGNERAYNWGLEVGFKVVGF